MNEIIPTEDQAITDFSNTQKLCAMLLKAPHYARIGIEGVFAIIETSKALGIDPRQGLSGLYYVKGKIEMTARMMNALIRSRGHSITKDKRSDDTLCILHGKRADTGDTWTESFSIKEANSAGLIRQGGPWTTFPRDMLFARALSRLARQLFPDLIGNVYVENEIGLDPNISGFPNSSIPSLPEIPDSSDEPAEVIDIALSDDQVKTLTDMLAQLPEYESQVGEFLLKKGISRYENIPLETYQKLVQNCEKKLGEKNAG